MMRRFGILILGIVVGFGLYSLLDRSPAATADPVEEVDRLAAIEKRLALVEKDHAAIKARLKKLETGRRMTNRSVERLHAEVGLMSKQVVQHDTDLAELKGERQGKQVNPFGIARRWAGKVEETKKSGGIVLLFYPMTLPAYTDPLHDLFQSKPSLAMLHVQNISKKHLLTFSPRHGQFELVMKNGAKRVSLDPRVVFLAKNPGSRLDQLPPMCKSQEILPGVSETVPVLFPEGIDFRQVKSVYWSVGNARLLLNEFNPSKAQPEPPKPDKEG